jgi:hypothetical protein
LAVDVGNNISIFAAAIEENPTLLPRLSSLTISAIHNPFDWIAFLQLVHTRHRDGPHRGLTSVQLTLTKKLGFLGDDSLGNDWLPRIVIVEFEKLVARDLKIQVIYHDQSWPGGRTGEESITSIVL